MAWPAAGYGLARPFRSPAPGAPSPRPVRSRLIVVRPRKWFVPIIQARRRIGEEVARGRSLLIDSAAFLRRFVVGLRGQYRVFNGPEYRCYRSMSGPPQESDTPFATSSSLPETPTDTFADGWWYVAVSYFNGVLDSGFLPIGPNGEHYVRFNAVAGGGGGSQQSSTAEPPNGPNSWELESRAGGVIRVNGIYLHSGQLRADTWAIDYTVDGTTPSEGAPDVAVTMPTDGIAALAYDLPAQAHGTTVKVRLRTQRGAAYSDDSTVKTVIADTVGGNIPLEGD